MGNGNNDQNDFGKYKQLVEDYENCCIIIKKIEEEISQKYNQKENNGQNCYLIDIKDFENYKQQIEFKIFKEKINDYKEELVTNFIMLESINKEVKLEKLQNINVNSSKELIDLLEKKNEYILINADLSKDIVKNKEKGLYFCLYSFSSSELIIKINEDSLHFNLNQNIININNLKVKEFLNTSDMGNTIENDNINMQSDILINNINDKNLKDNNNLLELINWLEKFYLSETKFKKSLNDKNDKDNKRYGYLIEIKAFNDWKLKLNYDYIKPILGNYIKENKIYLTEEEKEGIITLLEDKEIKKDKIQSLNFSSIEELRNYNRINDLILISSELLTLINEEEEKNNEIGYQISNEKKIEIIIDNKKDEFFKLENIIYSYITFNLNLLIKIFIMRKDIFKGTKPINIFIFKKDYLNEYKNLFDYENLQQIFEGSNLINKKDDRQIYEFIETIPDSYNNLVKENIVNLGSIKFDNINNKLNEIKIDENVTFNYIEEFDKIIFEGGSIVNFCKFNSIQKKEFIRTKICFIKEKILMIFNKNENENEKNIKYAQIGELKELENNYIFSIDYLIGTKKGKIEYTSFDKILKEEESLNNLYQKIYKENSESYFEYKLSEEIILSFYNFNKIINKDSIIGENIHKQNPFFINNTNDNEITNLENQTNNLNNNQNNNIHPAQVNEINNQPFQKENPTDNIINDNKNLAGNDKFINIPNHFYLLNQNMSDDNKDKNNDKTTQLAIKNNLGNNNIINSCIELNDNNNYNNKNTNQNIQEGGNNYDNNSNNNIMNQNQINNINNFNYVDMNNNMMNNQNQMFINNNNLPIQYPPMQTMYDFNKLKNYLYVLISFFQSDLSIKMKINRKYNQAWNYKEILYLINKQWINAFLAIFNINNEIYNLISTRQNILSLNTDNIIENIFQVLSDNTKQYLNNLDYNNIKGKLADNSLLKIDEQWININGSNRRVFFNFYFINENFCNCLSSFMNFNISQFFNKSESILINQKIFSFTNENTAYIGNIGMNYSFNTEKIVFYYNKEVENDIVNMVQADNVNYFNYLVFSGDFISNGFNIQILNVNQQKSIKNSFIIEKLKDFINFENYKNKLNDETNEAIQNQICKQEVILIKKESLDTIRYKPIMNIINKYIKSLGNNFSNQLNDNLVNFLNIDDIQLIKQEFNKINFNNINLDDILPKPDSLISFEDKNISIYNDVFVIKKDLIRLFINKVDIDNEYVKHIVSGNGINIIIIKTNEENNLLLGNVINNENSFQLQYIFNYKDENNMDRGLKKIYNDHIIYIENSCMFGKDEYLVSPIFGRKEEIVGYAYKCNDNLLNISLYDFYLCDNFKNVIELFNYYTFLNNKVKNMDNSYYRKITLSSNDYSLVNKKWIEQFKECFNYNNITSEINSGKDIENVIHNNNQTNFESTDKSIFSVIKNLNIDSYMKYNSDLKYKSLGNIDSVPELTNAGFKDSQNNLHQFWIPNNFEIIPKNFIDKFKDNNNNLLPEQNFDEIQIIDSFLLINLPYDSNGSGKYISLIGELNYDISLEIKSALIYYQKIQKREILEEENYNLRNIINEKEKRYFKQRDNIYYDECFAIQLDPNLNSVNNDDIYNINSPNDNNIYNENNDGFIQVKEIEYDLDYQSMYPFIKNNFPSPPLIGLDNIGATCYMNATLQCFCNMEQFVNYFKYDKYLIYTIKNDQQKKTLSSSFKLLIEKLWPNNYFMNNHKSSYSPYEFKNKISKMNPLFQGIAANDSKDLVNFLIMTLHEELNTSKNQKVDDNIFNIDQRNMTLVYNSFLQQFNTSNNSIISQLFYAINSNITECQSCFTKTYNFQTYFFLVFPLEEVRKFKLNNNQFNNYNNIINNNEVTIYDCFDFEKKINFMTGQNMMYCNYCRQTCNTSMCSFLFTGPEILIIILNRGKGIQYNVKINFLEDLNLNGYINMANTGCFYKLIGVITHLGESGMGGHFISYCKNPINFQWNKYNDSTVSSVNDFKSEVIDYAMPYLLFYQKQH